MATKVFLSYGALISPLGDDLEGHFLALNSNQSGIQKFDEIGYKQEACYLSKMVEIQENRFDSLLRKSLLKLKTKYEKAILDHPKTLFILSSTKGNLDDLYIDSFASARKIIKEELNNYNDLIIVSNACISGVVAINKAADYVKYSEFEHVFVIGIDVISDFILYGFQSLFAISDLPTQPFDKTRKGITLGEACGIICVSREKPNAFSVEHLAGASSNDANHISGPSRTGEGLYRAIQQAFDKSNLKNNDIDYISAHGTGTIYNDEMESIAFTRCGLNQIPVNSLKGYFGHTLGAAGVIETMICMLQIEKQLVFNSLGFSEQGTTENLNIVQKNQNLPLNVVLKTTSGFGGGNAVLVIKKMQ